MNKITIGKATLMNCDCMEYLATLPDSAFDLAIVDPPYGIGVNHNMGRRAGNKASDFKPADWDNQPPPIEYFNELKRVSKNQIVWGANHFIDRIGMPSSCWIVWDKLFSEEVSFASCELAYTSFQTVTKRIKLSSARPDGIHPTQKPVKLIERLISIFTDEGDVVIDPCAGSGSTLIAAHNLNRRGYGFEIKKDFYKLANNWIETNKNQSSLFQFEKPKYSQKDLVLA